MDVSFSKQRILDEALKLFSTNGYDATSIREIAEAVGIRKASLYSHFSSKQEILDTLIAQLHEIYEEKSLFVKVNWEDSEEKHSEFITHSEEDIYGIIKKQFYAIINNTYVNMIGKLLTIEQYRNPDIAALQNKLLYTDVLNFHKGLIRYLIKHEVFINEDSEIIAIEFFSPVSIQLFRVQRQPECEEDALRIIEAHIKHMCRIYRRK